MNHAMLRLTSGLLLLLAPLFVAFAADSPEFKEGVHYQRLSTPVPTSTGDKIEVTEIFWYGCPHCYDLEPTVAEWLTRKPDNVVFIQLPATLGRKPGEAHARAFYTAETLGILDQINKQIMTAIHVEKRRVDTEDQLAAFFVKQGVSEEDFFFDDWGVASNMGGFSAKQGVSEEDFRKTYNSFAVETKFRRAQDLIKRYQVNGVPAFVVNGKFLTNASMAGSSEKIFEVVDFLVQQEAKAG